MRDIMMLDIEDDIRVDDEREELEMCRMRRHLASRGIRVPRYVNTYVSLVKYYENWRNE